MLASAMLLVVAGAVGLRSGRRQCLALLVAAGVLSAFMISCGAGPRRGPALVVASKTIPGATAGAAYSTTLQASGGVTPYSWSLGSGSLPPGLALNPTSGVLSGTPTASGTFHFAVQVRDSAPSPATVAQSLTLTVSSSPNTVELKIGLKFREMVKPIATVQITIPD